MHTQVKQKSATLAMLSQAIVIQICNEVKMLTVPNFLPQDAAHACAGCLTGCEVSQRVAMLPETSSTRQKKQQGAACIVSSLQLVCCSLLIVRQLLPRLQLPFKPSNPRGSTTHLHNVKLT